MAKTYVLNFTNNAAIHDVAEIVKYDRRILSYWNYLPYVYCVKTELSARELAQLFYGIASTYFIAEINPDSVNGRLPKQAWEWFKAPAEAQDALLDRH
jgi:hypothetical protein